MADDRKAKRVRRSFFCPHCDTDVSKTTFYHHKSLYYCKDTGEWNSQKSINHELPLEINSSDDSDTIDADHSPIVPDYQVDATTANTDEPEACYSDPDRDENDSDIDENDFDEPLQEIWDTDESIDTDQGMEDSDDLTISDNESSETEYGGRSYSHALSLFVLSWQYRFHLSDAAISALMTFISAFLTLLNAIVQSKFLASMLECLPNTVAKCQHLLGIEKSFETFVCCKKCDATYELESCFAKENGKKVSKRCTHIEYKHHPYIRYRKECGALLLKEVRIGSKLFHYPFRNFCYKSVVESLKHMMSHHGFLEKCEHWRERVNVPQELRDVYDGLIWKEFQCVSGRDFLNQPNSFALMMNVDWFQPFKHTTYSVGALYLVVMNLPREERFRPENIIICGLIPGPNEPSKHINQYMVKLVGELIELWDGVYISVSTVPVPVRIRAALMCVASDIPATRKVCGFTGHNSTMGCSKCLKSFSIKVGQPNDYSGYNRANWEYRTNEHHLLYSQKYKHARSRKEREDIEHKTGVRFSILTDLPYFNCVRHHIIDPMHNLLLGTAKRMMTLWIECGILTKDKFDEVQECVDSFFLPSDVGRIPYRICSGFSGFKADQWRSWTTVFSLVSLKEILPAPHYSCWCLYVRACQILCSRTLSIHSLEKADDLLVEFCYSFVSLYGAEKTTPNMHLHLHLRESILDYGPVYAFWLFSYERYNGILGSVPTNNRAIEVQLMKRFVCDQQLREQGSSDQLSSTTSNILSKFSNMKGSLASQTSSHECKGLGPALEDAFECTEVEMLSKVYKNGSHSAEILLSYRKYKALLYKGHIFGSILSRSNSCAIVAKHPNGKTRIAQIQHFCFHKIKMCADEVCNTICAYVNWYEEHPETFWFSTSVFVCCKYHSESSFILLSDILSRAAICYKDINFPSGPEKVVCAVPLEYY